MPANTNRNYLAHWCAAQLPIEGIDKNRGNTGIEDYLDTAEGRKYTNPGIRAVFFLPAVKDEYIRRLKADLGEDRIGIVTLAPNFDTTTDPLKRASYYVEVDGQMVALNIFRHFASTGQDKNGFQVWDDKNYAIAVDGPGTFSYTDGEIGFTPQRR